MKKLFRLTLALAIVSALGWVWFQGSVYANLIKTRQASAAGDLQTVEELADLDAWAKTSIDFSVAYSEQALKKEVGIEGGLLGKLVSGIAGVLSDPLKTNSAGKVGAEIRQQIAAGKKLDKVGPFSPSQSIFDIPSVEIQGDRAYAILKGTCEGEPARARVRFVRIHKGPLDLFAQWRSAGMDKSDIDTFTAACVRGARRGVKRGSK